MKILLTLSYLGTNFHGWQVQPGCRTVQATLQEACEALFGCAVDITGCSRTDAGVHANRFCATASPKEGSFINRIPAERIPAALNVKLPRDLSVIDACEVPDDFHARYDVISKEYEYLIRDRLPRSPFYEDRAWQIPRPLDEALMNEACAPFIGRHDFGGFMASGSDIADTVRTIRSFRVFRCGELVHIRVSADGFLYNMVRILTGTLVAVSEGKITVGDLPGIIASRDRTRAGNTAPAHGLYLNNVIYPDF